MFSKSALAVSSKWQIFTCFGCFCTLIRRNVKFAKHFTPSFRDSINALVGVVIQP